MQRGYFYMKIGLLGFGSMGKTHTYSVENLKFFYDFNELKRIGADNIKIAAVCTRTLESAKRASEQYGIDSYTTNEDDIIYSDEIDAIDVCTPNIYHYETVKKAILAGKHVYCEKPLAVTYEQAKELSDLAREKNVKCHMVFNNRFLLPIIRAKEIIERGTLGKILTFNACYHHSSALNPNKTGWKQDKDICGGGVLFDLGSHVVDLIYYLCGEVESVIGKSQIVYPVRIGVNGKEWKTNADEAFHMIATLKCGAVGTMTVSKITLGSNDDLKIEINGEKGCIRFDLMNPNFLELYTVDSQGYTKIECVNRYDYPAGIFPGIKAPIGWLRGHIGNYYSFVSSVLEDKEPSISFDDGAYVQLVLERAYESSKDGAEKRI